MAKPLHYFFIIVSFFLVFSFNVAISSNRVYPRLKSLHFTLYEHGTFNRTAYLILNGVDAAPESESSLTKFGSLIAFHDPLTIKPNSSSKVVGFMEGTGVVSTLDSSFQTINVIKIPLNLKKHKGSISVVGATPFTAPGTMPVVGGTGDFMFVQGYLTMTPIHFTFPTFSFKNEFHLYWPPPYATY